MKKRYILRNGEKQHCAVVAREGDRLAVQIDDGPLQEVDAAVVHNGRALSLRLGDRMHLVHLSGAGNRGGVTATLLGRPVELTVLDELHALALDSLDATAGGGTVVSEIPGLVVEIKVREGQKVHQGEPVIVVEAMKMQNELAAGVTGKVAAIPVAVGKTVNPGEPLVVIEAEAGG